VKEELVVDGGRDGNRVIKNRIHSKGGPLE
jgi:hypothetical protein